MRKEASRDFGKCRACNACQDLIACPGGGLRTGEKCIGCGACYWVCLHNAIEMVPADDMGKVSIKVDESFFEVPNGITVLKALEGLGFHIKDFPDEEEGIYAPCKTGGCWSCALEINGQLLPACFTAIKDGMRIKTASENIIPKRKIGGFFGHLAGGVGTPWQLKGRDSIIETVCFTVGCNFHCPQCQNWIITFMSVLDPLTPNEAAMKMTLARQKNKVDRMTISGGESTLNKSWLIQYLTELKRLNPEPQTRFHVDTNGSILTKDYIDELVQAGMTDIGIDLKAHDINTFMKITGLENQKLAQKYKDVALKSVKYILEKYPDIFLGIGIPYNRELTSLKEIEIMGQKIAQLNPDVQVSALDYRAEYRRPDLPPPTDQEMREVHSLLKSTGLKTVICQIRGNHIGPDGNLISSS